MPTGKSRVPVEGVKSVARISRLVVGHLVAALLLVLDGANSPARSCGGFFCSNLPMNQTAERILLIAADEQVTANVQIQFAGTAEDFAWVLPVPSVPVLSVSHNEIFR